MATEFRKEGKSPEQVLNAVQIYHAIPTNLESAYREAIVRASRALIAPLGKPEA